MMATDMGMDKRGEIPAVQGFEEQKIKAKMEPERRTLESSPAGTGVEVPKQLRLTCREMRPTTVGSYRPADVRGLDPGE